MLKVHFHPILCGSDWLADIHTVITVSKDINEVTCQKCVYFYFHPEAKALNEFYRNKYNA